MIVNLKDLTESRKADRETLNLFDLSYIVRAVVQLSEEGRLPPACVVLPLDYYLHEHQETTTKNKRMMRKYQVGVSQQLKTTIYGFLWNNLDKLERTPNVYRMLAGSFEEPLSSLDTIQSFLAG